MTKKKAKKIKKLEPPKKDEEIMGYFDSFSVRKKYVLKQYDKFDQIETVLTANNIRELKKKFNALGMG